MGDFGAALVVSGVVGYILLRHCCHRTRFRWDGIEWQQNVFESAAAGLIAFAFSSLMISILAALSG